MSRLLSSLTASVCLLIPAAAQAGQATAELPEGPGKPLVQQICTQCHNLNQILNSSGYTREHWQELIGYMVDLSPVPQQRETIVEYLATHFPPNARRAPTPVSGSARITFTSWRVPKLGQRARDPVMTPDGAIWWAGQFGNVVGRLDPNTGEMKEYELPAGARPHSITPDAEGNVWYMGNANGTIGRIDAKTGEIKVYTLPDPAARDPHTAVFDSKGRLFFTVQNAQMLGRLIPATGEINLVKLPAPEKNPYGIKVDRDGMLWIACSESNCILKLDPETLEVQEFKLPNPESRVRRIAFTSDGMLWYGNHGLGTIGRFDPRTGETKEWASPSGSLSSPYGLEVVDDIVWYNESGKRPDMLVRFDPKTETFQSWPIASGNVYAGIVRHMRATPDGDLLIHQSSTNHIIRVNIEE